MRLDVRLGVGTTWRHEIPQWLLIAGMFILTALSWPSAPDRIPVHWNAAWQVDRYGGKVEGLLLLPAMTLGLYLLLLLAPRIDPGRANYQRFAGVYNAFRLTIVTFLAVLHGAVLLSLRGYAIDLSTVMPLAIGALFVLIGNWMGKIRPNWFMGIRTPWTLSSKVAWVKTHRLGGWFFVGLGLACMASGVLHAPWLGSVIIGLLLVGVVVLSAYSYLVWRKDPDKVPPAGTLPAE